MRDGEHHTTPNDLQDETDLEAEEEVRIRCCRGCNDLTAGEDELVRNDRIISQALTVCQPRVAYKKR